TRVARWRGDLHRRPARERPRSERPQHRDGVPELRALPAHDRLQEPRLPAGKSEDSGGRSRSAGPTNRETSADRAPARPEAGSAERPTAATGRGTSGDRAGGASGTQGLAVEEPG